MRSRRKEPVCNDGYSRKEARTELKKAMAGSRDPSQTKRDSSNENKRPKSPKAKAKAKAKATPKAKAKDDQGKLIFCPFLLMGKCRFMDDPDKCGFTHNEKYRNNKAKGSTGAVAEVISDTEG